MKTMHLFAGAGGGLLCDLILGHEPIVAVEWDAYCCKVLRERAADGWFPDLHVWEGDIRLFDPSEYTGRVDVVHAGFPCQDISGAGNQSGVGEGTRSGLYREVLRIADVVRPRYLFMENVSAILANEWLGTVLGDLAARGYDARWTCIPASATGAPHYRDRWWLLAERAYAKGVGSQGGQASSVDAEGNRSRLQPKSSRMGGGYAEDAADASRGRCVQPEGGQVEQPGRAKAVCTSKDVADAPDTGVHKRWGFSCIGTDVCQLRRNEGDGLSGCGQEEAELLDDAMRQCIQGEQPSGAYEKERAGSERGSLGSRGNGLGWWSTEPGVCRVANGIPNRAHRIKALGNAQVPIQAALAWMMLGGPT